MKRTVVTAAMTLAAACAQAGVETAFLAGAEDIVGIELQSDVSSGTDTALLFSTDRSAAVRDSQASLRLSVDMVSGVVRSSVFAVAGDQSARSFVDVRLTDTLRILGPGPTAPVTFGIAWDATVLGVGFEPNPAVTDETLNYQAEETALAYRILSVSAGSLLAGSLTHSTGGTAIQASSTVDVGPAEPDGVLNGRDRGFLTMVLDLPTGQDINLTYTVQGITRCELVRFCSVSVSSLQSDYVGVLAGPGVTVVSANGLRYDAFAAAVPEPTSAALALAGLCGLGLVRRRR